MSDLVRWSMGSSVVWLWSLGACGMELGPQAEGVTSVQWDDGIRKHVEASVFIAHYDYRFDLASRAARASLRAVVETPGNCLRLPFRAEGFDPETALMDGRPVASSLEGTMLRLCDERVRAAGETMSLDVDLVVPLRTLGESQVGYSVTLDAQRNPFHYLTSWIGDCDRFAPCDTRPGHFATYTFRVTHPPELLVRCPGTITEPSPTETVCDFDHEGGPSYSTFGIAAYPASAWQRIDKGRWGSARVTLYDRPQTAISSKIVPEYHAGFMDFLESTFGRYPFGDELRILTAPTYWSGFEHAGNIILNDGLATTWSLYLHPVAHVVNHEIAHMWAGNETTLAGTYDFVWKEAVAEYLAYVYESMTEPMAALGTAAAWKLFSLRRRHFPVPLEQPALIDYYSDVYGPGPMILFRQLEVLTSRERMIQALQRVLGSPRALSVDELVEALEASTGLELQDYADAWLRGVGAPVWPQVALTYDAGSVSDRLGVQVTSGAERRCKFHVALRGSGSDELQLVSVDTLHGGVQQAITIQPRPAFPVVALELDPLQECLVFSAGGPASIAASVPAHPWRARSPSIRE